MINELTFFQSLLFYLAVFLITYFLLLVSNRLLSAGHANVIGYKRLSFKPKGSFVSFGVIFAACLPVLLLLFLRVDVGRDFQNYATIFHDYTNYGIADVEVSTKWLILLANYLNLGYKGFLVFSSVISFFIFALALSKFDFGAIYPLAVFLYLCIYLGPLCNIMAQSMALSFCLLSYLYMTKRKVFLPLVMIALASLFHVSSLVLIPFYFLFLILEKKHSVVPSVLVLLLCLIISIFPTLLENAFLIVGINKYIGYFERETLRTPLILLLYHSPLYLFEFVLFFTRFNRKKSTRKNLFFNLVILEAAMLVLSLGVSWAFRLHYFFSVGHVLLISEFLHTRKKDERLVFGLLSVVYFVALFYLLFFFSEYDAISIYKWSFEYNYV